jgi:glutamate-1-semialdehyde 2,1-aminomutase
MGLQGERTAQWFQRSQNALVNGVSSMFRYWGPDDTPVIDRGEGGHVYDMDGNRYIDYQLGFGPVILGHGHPKVVTAVAEAAADGTTFAMTQRREIEAAEVIRKAIPWAEGIRFSNTGTEATMHSLRIARAYTGKDVVLKFEGQYHGVHDYVLFSTASVDPSTFGSRYAPIAVQVSSGIPESIRSYVRTVPYNDLDALERVFRNHSEEIAAVIVEPMLGNAFGIMPQPGFLEGVRAICDEYEAVLIFDEVKTGFRIALGGAQEYFGVTPDIAAFAKAMGNGFPVAAIAARGGILDAWAKGGIAQAGTYAGNGVAAAAAYATVSELATGEPYEQIEKVGRSLMEGLERILRDHSVDGCVLGVPAMFSVFLGEGEVKDFRDATRHDSDLYEEVCYGMIRRGVMPCPDALEPWFICASHTEEDVATTLQAFEEALVEALD